MGPQHGDTAVGRGTEASLEQQRLQRALEMLQKHLQPSKKREKNPKSAELEIKVSFNKRDPGAGETKVLYGARWLPP